jgi:hypothetical protein
MPDGCPDVSLSCLILLIEKQDTPARIAACLVAFDSGNNNFLCFLFVTFLYNVGCYFFPHTVNCVCLSGCHNVLI